MNYLQRLIRRALDDGERLPRTPLPDPFDASAPWALDAPAPAAVAPLTTPTRQREPLVALQVIAAPPPIAEPVSTNRATPSDARPGEAQPSPSEPPHGVAPPRADEARAPSSTRPGIEPPMPPLASVPAGEVQAVLRDHAQPAFGGVPIPRGLSAFDIPATRDDALRPIPRTHPADALRPPVPPVRLLPQSVPSRPVPPAGEPAAAPSLAIGRIEVEVREPRPAPAPAPPVVLHMAPAAAASLGRDASFVPASQRFGIGQT